MQRLIITAAIIALFFIGCNKEQDERIPAPIGYGVDTNTTLEIELQIAERELLARMYECSVRQAVQGAQRVQRLELTRASPAKK